MGRPRIVRTVADVTTVLKSRRWSLERTQEEVADRARLDQSRVSEYETGKRRPGLDVVFRLADALDMDVALIPREDRDG